MLQKQCPLSARLAIVLGSGFGPVLDHVEVVSKVPYASLPGFPTVGVSGHKGQVVCGHLGDTPVLVLAGRAHYYEGHDVERVTFAVRTLAAFGVTDLLLTNAAAGVKCPISSGDFMMLRDHINFMGEDPLRGPERPGLPRFVT